MKICIFFFLIEYKLVGLQNINTYGMNNVNKLNFIFIKRLAKEPTNFTFECNLIRVSTKRKIEILGFNFY